MAFCSAHLVKDVDGATAGHSTQVPLHLHKVLVAKQDVIVSHESTRIDFHGGYCGRARQHLSVSQLKQVNDAFVMSLLHTGMTSISVNLCKNLTDTSIKAIASGCPKLMELHMSYLKNLTDESIKAIADGCPELKVLNVSYIHFYLTDESIMAIAKGCRGLKELNLFFVTTLTDQSIKAIAESCAELEELNVSYIYNLTDESIKAIAEGCPKLKVLNVFRCKNLTDESVTAIAKRCPELKVLNVFRCKNLTNESIKAIAEGCPELEELNLSYIYTLTDVSIIAIGKVCPKLKVLNIFRCKGLTDESIKAIANGCPKLEELNVSGIESLTDESITAVAKSRSELKKLNVSRCKSLTDESIKAISEFCPELKELNVSYITNLTNDSINAITAGCKVLTRLEASACSLTLLPDDIGDRLSKLSWLEIYNNNLTKLPRSIVRLKHLEYLDVNNNPLQRPPLAIVKQGMRAIQRYFERAIDVRVLGELREVRQANLNVAGLDDDERIDCHGGCEDSELRHRCLSFSESDRVTDSFVMSLLRHEVTSINFNLCRNLTDESIKAIATSCPALEELSVSRCCKVTDDSIMAIATGCPELEKLDVSFCNNLTDGSIKAIAESCPVLKQLNVSHCFKLTDDSIMVIATGCPELEKLDVSRCNNLTDESIKVIAEFCPELMELDVTNCSNLTDESIREIAYGCPELKKLVVSECTKLTDKSIMTIAKGSPELKELHAEGCLNLTNQSIKAIANGCPELAKLNVACVENLKDGSITAIAHGCPELKELNVYKCSRLTDEAITAIAKGCPKLEELNVAYCSNLTEESIEAVGACCPKLKELNVQDCCNVTDDSIKAIAQGCPELKRLNALDCLIITDEAVMAVARGCRGLKGVCISDGLGRNLNLTDESIRALANENPYLEELNVERSSNFTDKSIEAIAEGCPELRELNVENCSNLTDESIKAIAKNCPFLRMLRAKKCGWTWLPDNIDDLLRDLALLDMTENELKALPPSIVRLKNLQFLKVDGNPLKSPPAHIAQQGLDTIRRYFEDLDRGWKVSKLLKVVLVGDGEAGKTALRNALAGRPNPRQEDRTIHVDIEKITLTDDLYINVYDCGGQEEYLATQLPYLAGRALYLVIVEAKYATDEYADALDNKLHRFLLVLQNRVSGAVILPVVTKIDTVEDPELRCHWLEKKVVKWLQDTREAVGGDSSMESRAQQTLAGIADGRCNAGNRDIRRFVPLRVQSPAVAVSVVDTMDLEEVDKSVRAVRDCIVRLTKHDPPLLDGVGQQIPTSYMAVLQLFGAIAEFGDNELALQALRHGMANPLGETSSLSQNGLYRPLNQLAQLWNTYCEAPKEEADDVFQKATQLWEAKGLIFVDAGLAVLQPEFIATLVKRLIDHRYNDENEYDCIRDTLVHFDLQATSSYNHSDHQLFEELEIYLRTGEIEVSSESMLLSFLWRDTGLIENHYDQVLQMLANSGVILNVQRDRRTVAIVPFRLPQIPDEQKLDLSWPRELPSMEREIIMRFQPMSGFPTGLAERFMADVHGLGTPLYSWRSGVVIKDSAGCTALTELKTNFLQFAVRFKSQAAVDEGAAWKMLCDAKQILAAQRANCFPGFVYEELLLCDECYRNGVKPLPTTQIDAKTRKRLLWTCGHFSPVNVIGANGHRGIHNTSITKPSNIKRNGEEAFGQQDLTLCNEQVLQ